MLDERKMEVLKAIVTDYVSSKEPVGSKALVERHQLKVSPATVRNDMAALEEEGYIMQPHTSAGRIPTDKGYRLFVDRIATVKPLSAAEKRAISSFMAGAVDVDDVIGRTVRLLAQVTRQVAIVQYPVTSTAQVRHVELVSLTSDRVLVILINSTGHVDQRSIELPAHCADDLATLRGRLNNALVGLTAVQCADRLSSLVVELAHQPPGVANAVVSAILEMLADDPSTRVAVAGVPNLSRLGDQFETTVKPVLEALEEQMVLLHLLGDAASGQTGDVTVRIGQENPYQGLQSTSVVVSTYGSDDEAWANLGIVGPTRMDYPSTMASVRAVARYVGRFLAEG